MFYRIVIGGFVAVVLSAMTGHDASARNRVPGEYATSAQPYWKVGAINKELSAACQRGEFGQRKDYWVTVGFVGGKGQGIVGVATSSWNLIDSDGLAKPNFTYHFFNQGFSNCKVYEAQSPRRR